MHTDIDGADRTFGVGHMNTRETMTDARLSLSLQVPNPDGNGVTSCAADHHGGGVGGEFQGTIDFGMGPLSGADPTLPTNFLVHLQP